MSASSHPPATSAANKAPFLLLVRVAMLMAVFIGLEVVVTFLPFAHRVVVALLFSLVILQFLCAIFFLMHLKWEKRFCTILFFIGIGLTGATVAAFLGVFGAEASVPLSSKDLSALPAAAHGRAVV